MSKQPEQSPGIRVVDEDHAADEVVRLGDDGPVVRLGPGKTAAAEAPARLEIGSPAEFVLRGQEPTVEELLEPTEAVVGGEQPLEEGWGGEAKRWLTVPWGWFALIAVICLGGALWSLQRLFENRHVAEQAVTRAVEIVEGERRLQEQARQLYQRLEQRIVSYLATATVDERLANVRQPDRVGPLMRDWYATRPLEAEEFLGLVAFQPITLERRPFWVVKVRTGAGTRALLLEQTDDDDGLVDWETDVCYQPMEWDRFVAERPEGSFEFRVNVAPDNFYAFEFGDEGRYRCLRLTTRGSDQHLFGYVVRGSAEEQAILPYLNRLGRPVPMILKLEPVTGSEAMRSVRVAGLVANRWCLVPGGAG